MVPPRYSLSQVLRIARVHPFYRPDIQYPPDANAVQAALADDDKEELAFETWPLLEKKAIYQAVERLVQDATAENTYRQSSYLSITGGGSGGHPMLFAVDVHENRQHRIQMGQFIRLCGLVSPSDWVFSTHVSGHFYRSLDLMTELLENAGATLLSGGNEMTPQEVIAALIHYQVNVLTGDGSQVIQVIHHISTLPPAEKARVKLNKLIYTSEPLTKPQLALVHATLPGVTVFSVLGSAEAGAWAISNPHLTGANTFDHSNNSADFVFDTRSMHIEIFPPTLLESDKGSSPGGGVVVPTPLPEGEAGIIVQTSLQRLRNPLVRYITGDIGSVHPLPESASTLIPDEEERKHLRVLRMQGRDRRFSFKWYAMYFEFETLNTFMATEEYGILQWQMILDQLDASTQTKLEIRLLRAPPGNPGILSDEALIKALHTFFFVLAENEHLLELVFVKNLDGFERSSTAGKVIKFIDRLH